MTSESLNIIAYCAIYLLVMNAITAALFWHDKRQAMSGGWRIPEKTLLVWALAGGSAGAFWASHKVRHKTRKQPFRKILWGIVIVQVAGLLWIMVSPEVVSGFLRNVVAPLPRIIS